MNTRSKLLTGYRMPQDPLRLDRESERLVECADY